MQATSDPVRFQDDTGVWRDVDTGLTAAKDGSLVPKSVEDPISIPKDPADGLVMIPSAAGTITLDRVAGAAVAAPQLVGDPATASAGKAAQFSSDAGDVLVRARRDGFEQDLVFSSEKQAKSAYRLVFEVPAGVTARAGGSGVEFATADGQVVGEFGGGLASDSKIDKTSGLGAETSVRSRLIAQDGTAVTVEVSVSEKWVTDPDRVFPVTIDPVWSHNTSMGGLQGFDTFVKSDLSSSQFSSTELRAGTLDSGATVSRSLVYFGLDGLPTGVGIASAKLKLFQTYATTCTATQLDVYGVGANWNTATVWSNAPNSDGYGPRATPSFSSGISGSCPSAWVDVDVTDLVRQWYAGTTPDLGVYLVAHDESAGSNYKRFASGDAGASTAPALEVTYSNPPAQSMPTTSTLADDYVIAQTTPTLATSVATDPDGDTVSYWYQVSSGPTPDSGSIVAQSGLIGSPSWMVPAGSLQDGGVYSWTVWTWDGTVFKKADWNRRFRVNLRIGDGGPSPKDTLGPFTVNLGNGNVSTGFSSPSFPTVAGSLGVSYAYSSKTPSPNGLTATYWQTKDLSGPSAGQRRETSLTNAIEANAAPMPGMWPGSFSARYTGLFVPPETGTYTFGVKSDDGVRIWVNNVLVIDDWHDHGAQLDPLWASTTVTLPQSVAVPIKVEYYNNTGRGSLEVFLKSTGTGGGASIAQQPVPSSSLRVSDALMPQGWTMTPDTDGTLEFVRASMVGNSVVFNDSSGGVHTWSSTGSGYVPLGGEEGTVTKNGDGTIRFEGSDGQVYLFRIDGSLDSVFNTADIKKPAAPVYTYEGTPARLTKVTDRVSGKAIKITYQGIGTVSTGACATAPSGFDATPPTGMPCLVDYTDFGAGQTKLYYSSGQLARVIDPGDATVGYPTSDFAYDTASVLTTVRSPLANDMIAAGVRTTSDLNASTVTYDANHMATAVYLPAVNSGPYAARLGHTYFDGLGTSYVNTAPTAPDATHYTTKVTFDDGLRQLATTDERNLTSTVAWNTTADIPIRTTDPAGVTTTTILDSRNRPTDSYGPAPSSWFQTSGLPTTAHSGDVPHSQTFYDEGIKGLAANYWDNATFTGLPKSYDTGVGDTTGKLTKSWGSAAPNGLSSASNWSARYTGDITFPETGTYTLKVATAEQQGVGLTVDGQHVIDANAPLSQMAVLGDSAGAKQLFARGANNELVWKYYSTTGTPGWSNWISLGGTITSAPTAVTLFGSSDVYARGTDNALWTKHYDGFAGTWGAWTSVAGPALAGAPAAVISNSQTHVFARAASNDSLMHYYKSGTTWYNENLGGTIVGDPATTAPTSTRPDVYARGTNNHLYHRFWNGSSWAAWEDLGGTMNSSPAASSSSSQMHVFYRSATNSLTHVWVNSLTPPWYSEDLGGTITTAPGVQQSGTRIDVVAQGTDNAIYQKAYTTSWQPWFSIGTSFRAGTYTVTSGRQGKPVPISIDLTQSTGDTKIDFRWCTGVTCTGEVSVPGSALNARYNLATRTVDADGHTTTTDYPDPALGLTTATHTDPAGLNLTTSNTFESAGSGYYRETAYRLPKDSGGNTQVDKAYWGDTATDPAGAGTASADCGTDAGVNQGGALKSREGATPATGHGATNRAKDEYVYDQAGRTVAHKASGDVHWECAHYDARGRVATTTDSSSTQRTSTSSYSFTTAAAAARQVTSVQEPDSTGTMHTTAASVDILGRPVAYTDEWGTISETDYDGLGRPVSSWRTLPGGSKVKVGSLSYGSANVVTSASEYLTNLTTGTATILGYDGVGRPVTVTRPISSGAVVSTSSYDTFGRIGSLVHTVGASTVWADTLGYALSGSIVHDQATNETRDYTFDAAGRLTQTNVGGAPTRFYSYDRNTNRCDTTAASGCDGTTSGALRYDNTDRIIASPAGASYTYDAAGNQLTAPQSGGVMVTMSYDTKNHATVVNDGTTTTAEVLTPSSRVLRHTVTRNSDSAVLDDTRYGYSGPDDSPDWTQPWAGGPITTYLGDRTVTQSNSATAGTATYWIANPHGDIAGTITGAGTFTANPTSDEFGVTSGAVPTNRLGWLGTKQRYGTQDGIIRMGQRLYDPKTGRFIQQDPVEGGSANDYDYVDADPINGFDLTGSYLIDGDRNGRPIRHIPKKPAASHRPHSSVTKHTSKSRPPSHKAKPKADPSPAESFFSMLGDAGGWVMDRAKTNIAETNRDPVGSAASTASWIAVGVCVTATIGACGFAVGASFVGRSISTISKYGFGKEAFGAIFGDAARTYFGFALVQVPLELSGVGGFGGIGPFLSQNFCAFRDCG